MKKNKPLKIVLILLLIAFAVAIIKEHYEVRQFKIIIPDVLYTSGQPRGMDYTRLLYRYHIATIINLRSPAEHRERNWHSEEVTWVRSNAVKYFEMPLERNIESPGHYPDPNTQAEFLAIMADKHSLPVLIHDSSGKSRPAMLAAVWLAKDKKLPAQEIIDIALKTNEAPLSQEQKQFIDSLTK